ncbi:hypothetical protein C8F01DRAFT_1264366 [Mycena amicta]|nr:hypothetical protein C8F01DRAFT_1264366 [Mycena amicta]
MANLSAARIEKMFRQLPNVDASQIRGNVSAEQNQINANIFAFYVSGKGGPRRYRIHSGRDGAVGRLEIEVVEDMCNVFGTMHGACGAYLIDQCVSSFSEFFKFLVLNLSLHLQVLQSARWFCTDAWQASTGRLDLDEHQLAPHRTANLGDSLEIYTQTVHFDHRSRMVRCEIRDKETRRLLVSGTNSFLNGGASTADFPRDPAPFAHVLAMAFDAAGNNHRSLSPQAGVQLEPDASQEASFPPAFSTMSSATPFSRRRPFKSHLSSEEHRHRTHHLEPLTIQTVLEPVLLPQVTSESST